MILFKFKKFIKSNKRLFFFYTRIILKLKVFFISDERYVKKKFIKNFGEEINLKTPKRYNEFISLILLSEPSELMKKCADKYEVRKFIKSKGFKDILNEIYGVYEDYHKIIEDFKKFPVKFVIKATHGCGWNYFVKDKNRIDFNDLKIHLHHWYNSNFYYYQREKIYKYLKPRFIVEKYLEDQNQIDGLVDYKIHCFYGEPKFVNVVFDRYKNMKLNTYDMNWNFIDVTFDKHYPPDKNKDFNKPIYIDRMFEISRILSRDFNYVRCDFYYVNNKIIFGELTFTPGNGAYEFTKEQDIFFGNFFKNI